LAGYRAPSRAGAVDRERQLSFISGVGVALKGGDDEGKWRRARKHGVISIAGAKSAV